MGRCIITMSLLKTLLLTTSIFLAFSLSGCEKKPTYSYLMLHPNHLQELYSQCSEDAVSASQPCDLIARAQADFAALVNQRQQDPERFGARIMQEQENSVFLRSKFNLAQQTYHTAGATQSKAEDLQKMHAELDKAEQDYQQSREEVKVLLAVIAATSMV